MSGMTDVVKGRIKEAAGALINNENLRNEGKKDQATGKAKEAVEESIREVKKEAQEAINKLKGVAK